MLFPSTKKDNKEHVENYRPISLLSLISKALERCVFNKIKDHVFELIEVFEYIGRESDLGKQVEVIYLDMSKAFDRISHMQLLKRLRDFGFGGNTLNWFRFYLKERRQQTTVLGATSSALPVTSGVPQGSILGPLLFLLYQNNLPNSINHSKIATFADDTKIYKVINAKADASAMENDLANFQTSSANANLPLNTDICKTLRITRKRNKIDHSYKLQDSALKTTDYELDLGVWTSSTLTWSIQVLHQCAQANKSLGYIPRSTIKIKTISIPTFINLTKNEKGDEVRFYRFPAPKRWKVSAEKRKRWIEACHRGDSFVCGKDSYICNLHFTDQNGPTPENPDPQSATASRAEKVDTTKIKSRRHAKGAVEALLDLHKSFMKSKSLADEEKMAIEGPVNLRLTSESPVPKANTTDTKSIASIQTPSLEVCEVDNLSADKAKQNKQDVCVQ
ncbi:RNA-directed DNA polymerase from mobile element jockey, partial [Paramuricea clavata]